MVYVIRLHTTTTCQQLGNDTTYDTEKKNPTSHDVADTSAVLGRRVGKKRHHVVKTNCGRHLKRRHFQLRLGESSSVAVGLYSTIVQLNSNRKRLNSMPTSTGHHHPDLNERDSTSLELGIIVINHPTKLRNRMVGMGN